MNNELLIERIIQNLSLEVEAVQIDDSVIQLTSTSRCAPHKVKVKIRKKNNDDTYHSIISVPKPHPTDMTVDKIRVINSDQTIMSFDMLMDTDQPLPTKKTRNKFFGLLKPVICLGKANNEKESYQPRKFQNNSSTTSQTHGVLKKHLDPSKEDCLHVSTAEPKRHQHFLGKCKPGGCLDPPFSEDKYSYTPLQKINERATSTLTKNNLHVGDDIGIPKQDLIIKSLSKGKLSRTNIHIQQERPQTNSIINLFQAESVNTSLSITYSNSIITYPPPLTSSEIRLNKEKNVYAQQIMSTENKSTKTFNEFSEAYFTPPKEIVTNFGYLNANRDELCPENEKNYFQNIFYLTNETGSIIKNMESICQDVTNITTLSTNTKKNEESGNADLKAAHAVDNTIVSNQESVDNHKLKDTILFDKSDSKKESTHLPIPIISTTHYLKSHETTSKSENITIKSIETLLNLSERSSMVETHLNLYKNLPKKMSPKENVILDKNSLLSFNENSKTMDNSGSISNISKSDSKNLYSSTILSERSCHVSKDTIAHTNNIDSKNFDAKKRILNNEIDSETNHLLEDTRELHNTNDEKEPFRTDFNMSTSCLKSAYNENNNVQVENTKPSSTSLEFESSSKLRDQQKNDFVENVDVYLANKENTTHELGLSASGTNFENKEGSVKEIILTKEIKIIPNMHTVPPGRHVNTEPSHTSMDTRFSINTSKYADNYNLLNQNVEQDLESSDRSQSKESSMTIKNDNILSLENHTDSKSFPTAQQPLYLTRSDQVLLADNIAELKDYELIKLGQYEIEHPSRRISEVIPDLKEAIEDVVRKSSVPVTEDIYNSFSPISEQKINLSNAKVTLYNESMDYQNRETVSIGFEKDGILIEDIVLFDPGSENLEETVFDNDSAMKEIAKDQSQHLLCDIENQLENYVIKDDNKYYSLMDQSKIQFLEGESKPSTIEKTLSVDLETKIIAISKKKSDIDHDTGKQHISKNKIDDVKPIDETLLRLDPKKIKQDKTTILSASATEPTDIKTINAIILDATDSLTLSQNKLNDTIEYNLISTETSKLSTSKFIKSDLPEKQYNAISLKSPMLIGEQNTTVDNANNKKDESYVMTSKIEKLSTMFDVNAFPDPKKLKKDIATLKYHSVMYTPSENIVTDVIKNDSITVDLAFHSYVNDKNDKIVKTFDSRKEPQRYVGDRVTIIKSDMDLSNNVIKIPIDSEKNLVVKFQRADRTDRIHQDNILKEDDKLCNAQEIDAKDFHIIEPNDAKIPNLHSIYEAELLPLQNAIKDLKDEIDCLAGHSLILRNNLLTRKLNPVKFTNINRRCVCLKRLF